MELTGEERYRVANDVVHRLKQHGDPWRLSEDLPTPGKRTLNLAAGLGSGPAGAVLLLPLFTPGRRGKLNRNVFALFGAVAMVLTATVALTLSRATLSADSAGSLKCYDTGGIEKAC